MSDVSLEKALEAENGFLRMSDKKTEAAREVFQTRNIELLEKVKDLEQLNYNQYQSLKHARLEAERTIVPGVTVASLRKQVRELEQYLDDYVDLGRGFAKRGIFIGYKEIDAAWEMVVAWTDKARDKVEVETGKTLEFLLREKLGICRCDMCDGSGEVCIDTDNGDCGKCERHGWVVKDE